MNKQTTFHINLVYALIFIMFLSGCSCFEQNDFIKSVSISNETNEHIFYNIYQTGLDNYRFEFWATYGADTTKLFEYYLNDAVFNAMRFSNTKMGDTLKIKTNFLTENFVAKTKNETIVILTSE